MRIRLAGELSPTTNIPELVRVARAKDRHSTRSGIHINACADAQTLTDLLVALYDLEAAGMQDENEFVCSVDDIDRVFDALHRLCGLEEISHAS